LEAPNQTIFVQYCPSELGQIEIHANEQGICYVAFRDAQKLAAKQVAATQTHPHLELCKQELAEYFAGTRHVFTVPLAPEGTAFQESVWQQLLQIPYGTTQSYLALSKQMGNEKAIRAVANANGKNPISLLIPCHRVMGSDGSLVGYAGDTWRKAFLLKLEGAISDSPQLQLF
jgi:methylated-DNA-[protein]-cysteine S-methyltransferase